MTINQLYEAAKGGNQKAENTLFEKLHVAFTYFTEHRINDRLDTEELVQEALMIISEKYRDIDFTSSFSAWAYKVLDNRIMHYMRKKYTSRKMNEKLRLEAKKSENANPELKIKLMDCLKKINKVNIRYARILNLRHQGYSTDEISQILETTPNNVLVILSRARSLLKYCLKKGDI